MKKIIIFIIIIITIFGIGYFFDILFGNYSIDLSQIDENEKKSIIELLKLEDSSNDITLEKLVIPKTYRDVYYAIYFVCLRDIDIEDIPKSDMDVEFEKKNDNHYICTISNMGKSIEILEEIQSKYQR